MPHVDEFPGVLGFTETRFPTTRSGLRSSGLKIKSLAFQLSKWNCPTGLDGGGFFRKSGLRGPLRDRQVVSGKKEPAMQ